MARGPTRLPVASRSSRESNGLLRGDAAMKRTVHDRKQGALESPRPKLLKPPERLTVVEAHFDLAPGDSLYIRGEGDGLSWASGQRLSRGFGGSWIWLTSKARR